MADSTVELHEVEVRKVLSTFPPGAVVAWLAIQAGTEPNAEAVADATHMAPGTVQWALDRLKSKGLLPEPVDAG